MGCGSGQNSTVTSTTAPPPEVLAAYQALLNRGTAAANLPLQQWQGPTIAGFTPTQQAAFGEISQAQGSALPYINAAQSYLGAGADDPFSQVETWNPYTLAQYENPYTQQVTQATQNLLNEQNAEQFNQARGQAASAGAFGGDREAVLESEMANQQQLAEAPTLAGIQSQGFTTAAGLLGQQQNLQLQGLEGNSWLNENAAAMEAGLGSQAMNSLLSGASAELQSGALQQQLEQEELNVPIEQFMQQQAYPFQTTDFLAGITEGAGGGMGGTGSTTSPGPSMLGQIAGLGMAGLGVYGMGNNLGWWGPGTSAADNAALGSMGSMASDVPLVGDTGSMGFAGARRGGRIGFPSVHRQIGGFVRGLPGVAGMSAGDLADVGSAINLASASPIPPMGVPHGVAGLPFLAPSSVANTNQDTTGQTIGTLAQLGMMAAMAFSDPALKHRCGEAKGALGALRRMKVDDARYRWEPEGEERPMLMADSVERAAPHAVSGEAPLRAIKPLELIPMLVRGVQELDRRTRRHGGRPLPGHHHMGFPKALAAGGDGGADLNTMLMATGTGMMASKSPFFLSQLGDGLQSALRYGASRQQLARDQNRAGPHVDMAGATMRLIYPNGSAFDTGLGVR